MLSFCFEDVYDDVIKANGSSRAQLDAFADMLELRQKLSDELAFKKKAEDSSMAPPDVAFQFYNGLGRKMGYFLPVDVYSDLKRTTMENAGRESPSDPHVYPWIMSNKEKEDLIKNGPYQDRFEKTQPHYVGPEEPPVIPPEYN